MPSEFDPKKASVFNSPSGENASFAPRLVGERAEDDELAVPDEWPADLEALAEQLTSDAEFLAATYPATEPVASATQVHAASVRRFSRWPWWAAAVLLVLAGTGVRTLMQQQNRAPAPVVELAAPWQAPREQPLVTPAVGFHELTPPEQEAVLDIIEDNGEPVLLSI